MKTSMNFLLLQEQFFGNLMGKLSINVYVPFRFAGNKWGFTRTSRISV